MRFRVADTEIAVNTPDHAALMQEVRARLAARRGFALATINLDHLVKLRLDARFRRAYAAQDLVVADGNPIVWLSRLAGRPVALLPGSDLVLPLVREAARAGVPVALAGSTETALTAAAENLTARVPGLRISARIAPPFGFDPESAAADQLLDQIADSGAGLCLLAFGAPKQEMLAERGRGRCPGVGFASVGAGLDFLAGTQQRAPALIRTLALEWLWRAVSSPARLGPRYLACFRILPSEIRAALAERRATYIR